MRIVANTIYIEINLISIIFKLTIFETQTLKCHKLLNILFVNKSSQSAGYLAIAILIKTNDTNQYFI